MTNFTRNILNNVVQTPDYRSAEPEHECGHDKKIQDKNEDSYVLKIFAFLLNTYWFIKFLCVHSWQCNTEWKNPDSDDRYNEEGESCTVLSWRFDESWVGYDKTLYDERYDAQSYGAPQKLSYCQNNPASH